MKSTPWGGVGVGGTHVVKTRLAERTEVAALYILEKNNQKSECITEGDGVRIIFHNLS